MNDFFEIKPKKEKRKMLIDGIENVPACTADGVIKIVILQRGWVMIGKATI